MIIVPYPTLRDVQLMFWSILPGNLTLQILRSTISDNTQYAFILRFNIVYKTKGFNFLRGWNLNSLLDKLHASGVDRIYNRYLVLFGYIIDWVHQYHKIFFVINIFFSVRWNQDIFWGSIFKLCNTLLILIFSMYIKYLSHWWTIAIIFPSIPGNKVSAWMFGIRKINICNMINCFRLIISGTFQSQQRLPLIWKIEFLSVLQK